MGETPENLFVAGLTENDPARVRKAPKADLHNHGLMGCRLQKAEKFFGEAITPFRFTGKGIDEINQWIRSCYFPVFNKEGAFEAIVEAAFETAKEEGVTVLEMSIEAGFGHRRGISPARIVEVLRETHKRVAPEIDYRPELGFPRTIPVRQFLAWFEAYLDFGFFRAIDLYDDELSQPIGNFREIYRFARRNGLVCKAHAGEFGTAESVREAVEVLGLDAVQHGIAAARSPEVMKWLAERGTRLNICPTSNVVLHRVPSLEAHPIRVLYDNGVKVTVNTDDVLLFGQGVAEEYMNLYNAGVMSAVELDDIRRNSLA